MNNASSKVIGVLLKGYPRLSETFIVNEILLLEQLGFNLHIFALRNPGEDKVHDSVKRVRAQVTYIPDYFWPYFGVFIKANVKLFFNRPRVYWRAFRFAAWRSLRQWSSSTIKRFSQAAYLVQRCMVAEQETANGATPPHGREHEERVRVAHLYAHFSHGPTTVAYFAAWLTGLQYSFSAHAKDIYLQEHDFLREKIRRAFFVTTCTEYNKNYLKEVAGTEAPVFRCYHGLDVDLFSVPVKLAGELPPRILSIGRFVPKKGFPILIRALHLLQQQGQVFHCDLIGGGELKEELKALAVELGLQACVHVHGAMAHHELFDYFRRADMFALACEVQNDGDRDGIPNVIVEAMAMGLPVVSTNISGIPECVEDGVTGILVAEKDPSAFAAGMASLIQNPQRGRQMGRAGRMKVEKDYDSLRNVERIGKALRQALENRGQQNFFLPEERDGRETQTARFAPRRESMTATPVS